MKLVIPETMKAMLVDDWEAVTKNNQVRTFRQLAPRHVRSCFSVTFKLVPLPRHPNVVEILKEFGEYVLAQPKTKYVYTSNLPLMLPLMAVFPAFETQKYFCQR